MRRLLLLAIPVLHRYVLLCFFVEADLYGRIHTIVEEAWQRTIIPSLG
eukprot:SAG31_NODE_3424_length_4291_cov_1.659113_6_plen_48_part_00